MDNKNVSIVLEKLKCRFNFNVKILLTYKQIKYMMKLSKRKT